MGRANPGRRFSSKNHGNAHNTGCKFWSITNNIKAQVAALTPHATSECNENTKSFCVVFHAFVGLQTFEDAHHDRENYDLAGGTHSERHVGDAIPRYRLEVGVLMQPV